MLADRIAVNGTASIITSNASLSIEGPIQQFYGAPVLSGRPIIVRTCNACRAHWGCEAWSAFVVRQYGFAQPCPGREHHQLYASMPF